MNETPQPAHTPDPIDFGEPWICKTDALGWEGAIALLKNCPTAELAEIADRAVEDAEAALRTDGSEVYSRGDDARREKWRKRLKRWTDAKEWLAKLSAISKQ